MITVFDWETTGRNKGTDFVGRAADRDRSGQPDPHHPLNSGVALGWANQEGYFSQYGYHTPDYDPVEWYKNTTLLVGHNIRFDLLYTMKHYPEFYDWLWETDCQIYDTQIAEYLLSGQSIIQPTLGLCCERHGMEGKLDVVSQMFKDGIQSQDIEPGLLMRYLRQDVEQTEELYYRQQDIIQQRSMGALVESQMRAVRATFEMSVNGLCVDMPKIQQYREACEIELIQHEETVMELYSARHPLLDPSKIKAGSPDMLSRCLYGGEYQYNVREQVGMYKNGSPKYKNVQRSSPVVGLLPEDAPRTPVKKAGMYEVSESILKGLLGICTDADAFLEAVLKYRTIHKDLKTYYIGWQELAYKRVVEQKERYFIHGNLNHCVTVTGRLSSSKPNLQNASAKDR